MKDTSKYENKVMAAFRFYPADLKELKDVSEKLRVNKTEIVERALHRYFYDLSQGKPA